MRAEHKLSPQSVQSSLTPLDLARMCAADTDIILALQGEEPWVHGIEQLAQARGMVMCHCPSLH